MQSLRLEKQLFNVTEALEFQTEVFGNIAFGRDQLYKLARAGTLKSVGNQRRILFIRSSLESLLKGEAQ